MVRNLSVAALRLRPIRALLDPTARALTAAGERLGAALSVIGGEAEGFPTSPVGDARRRLIVRLELIGPSGVGKSTLARHLLINRQLRHYLKRFGALTTGDAVLRALPNTWQGTPTRHDDLYSLLLSAKLNQVVRSDVSAESKAKLLSWISANLHEDVRLSNVQKPYTVVRAEGLVHNFGDVIGSELASTDVRELLHKRVVLRLKAPSKLIAQRAIARQAAGAARLQYVGQTASGAERVVRDADTAIHATVERLLAAGVPVIEVDVSGPATVFPADLVESIVECIAQIQK